MRIPLDLDRITFNAFMRKLRLVKIMFPQKKIQAEKSAGRQGYHITVFQACKSFDEALQMRHWLGDDQKRIMHDSVNFRRGICSQVLFDKKNGQEVVRY